MLWFDTNSSSALRRRTRERFRTLFGAPRFTIARHIPWPRRAFFLLLAIMLGYGLGLWSTNDDALRQENEALRAKIATEDASAKYAGTVALLHIAQSAQQQLSDQVKTLQDENNRLREETALYEKLTVPRSERVKKGDEQH